MKPDNWSKLSAEAQAEYGQSLFNSMRGRLIIGQALAIASARLATETYPETSNMEDMESLGETLFAPWYQHYVERLKEKA
jgi:hypothetical protein